MTRNICGIVSLVLFCFLPYRPEAHHPPVPANGSNEDSCAHTIFCPGEELVYEVSWLSVKLGQVRLRSTSSTLRGDTLVHHAVAYIDSYEGLPFVDLHAIDHTEMDSVYFSLGYHATEHKNDSWHHESAQFTPGHKSVIIETATQKERRLLAGSPMHRDTLELPDPAIQDGLSILYFARSKVHRHTSLIVPTLVYGVMGKTRFLFSNEKQLEEIDAVKDKKIRAVLFRGKAEFEGVFGLTGDFKGWVSDDDAAVPIKAELRVLIGSIKLELIEWKRAGWTPPTE